MKIPFIVLCALMLFGTPVSAEAKPHSPGKGHHGPTKHTASFHFVTGLADTSLQKGFRFGVEPNRYSGVEFQALVHDVELLSVSAAAVGRGWFGVGQFSSFMVGRLGVGATSNEVDSMGWTYGSLGLGLRPNAFFNAELTSGPQINDDGSLTWRTEFAIGGIWPEPRVPKRAGAKKRRSPKKPPPKKKKHPRG